MKKWIYNVLLVIFTLVFIGSGVVVGMYVWDTYSRENRYDQLAELRPTAEAPKNDHNDEQTVPTETTEPAPTEPKYVDVTDPKTGETRTILAGFAELYGMNSDMVGWLRIPAIGVDYPVMHTPEDENYYIRRNFDKKKSSGGCLFVEDDCDVFEPTDNVIIYGHHMRDGTMFGKLKKFRSASFRDKNPYIYFDTLTEMHTYEIMSVFVTTATLGKGFAYYNFADAKDQKEFDEYVAKCKKLALYDTGVDAVYGDKLICLATCDYSVVNGRLLVVAKRIS